MHPYSDTTYDVKEVVTIQCDASQKGLGSTLLQKGQPVVFVSRSLSSTHKYVYSSTNYVEHKWSGSIPFMLSQVVRSKHK